MNKEIIPVMFGDGVVVEDGQVRIFMVGDLQIDDPGVTRLFFYTVNNEWTYHDVATVGTTLCVTRKPETTYFALGRDGRVFWSNNRTEWIEEEIPDAGVGANKYGYLARIKDIDGDVYACGHRGQVYRRIGDGWVHMDEGLLTEKRGHVTSHHAIDGTAADDIYVAGNNGRVYYYDGNVWSDVSPETNVDLLNLLCIDSEKVYVCGDNGLLYVGNRNGWKLLCEPTKGLSIWDIEEFNDTLYLVLENKLGVYDSGSILTLDTKLDPPVDAFNLNSRGDVLWSFGEEDLAYFEDEKWTRVLHPHNEL